MVLGETGCLPIEIHIKCRMVNFWHKLATSSNKICVQMYKLLLKEAANDENGTSSWLTFIKSILNSSGFTYVWNSQGLSVNKNWLKCALFQSLKDQFIQKWKNDLSVSTTCNTYRCINVSFGYENI